MRPSGEAAPRGRHGPALHSSGESSRPVELVVALRGELDLAGVDIVKQGLLAAIGPTVVVDLSELTFVDAAGLGALVQAKRHIEGRGHRLVLQGAHGFVARVFEAAGLHTYLLGEGSISSPE